MLRIAREAEQFLINPRFIYVHSPSFYGKRHQSMCGAKPINIKITKLFAIIFEGQIIISFINLLFKKIYTCLYNMNDNRK